MTYVKKYRRKNNFLIGKVKTNEKKHAFKRKKNV